MAKPPKKLPITKLKPTTSKPSARTKETKKEAIAESRLAVLTRLLKNAASYHKKTTEHPGWRHACLEELVLEKGKSYISQKLPNGIRRRKKKYCFCNAFHLADNNPDFTYVEGFALSGTVGTSVLHAWVVDKNDRVIDNTWDNPEFCVYFGIPFDFGFVRKTMNRTENYGVLSQVSNDDELQKFLRKGLLKSAIK